MRVGMSGCIHQNVVAGEATRRAVVAMMMLLLYAGCLALDRSRDMRRTLFSFQNNDVLQKIDRVHHIDSRIAGS